MPLSPFGPPVVAPVDGSASTPSLRTLGTGASQAAAGNDSRFSALTPTVHNVRSATYGAVGDGVANDAPAFQAALNAARDSSTIKEVYVPPGNYLLNTRLSIASNVTMRLSPQARLIRGGNTDAMIINESAGTLGGYTANSNIRVVGGTWDMNGLTYTTPSTAIAFGHCTDVVIEDCLITNVPTYHHIEVNGSYRVRISRCFLLQGNVTGDESIQLDGMYGNGPFPWFGPYDNTPMKSVVVENCYFNTQNVGIGTHSAATGVKHSDVVIRECIFDGLSGAGVAAYAWENVHIKDNFFINCKAGIRLTTPNIDTTTICDGFKITGNRWTGYMIPGGEASCVVLTCGTVTRPQVRFITLTDNTFDNTGGYVVSIAYGEEISITGNIFSRANGARNSIFLSNCNTSSVTGNTINDSFASAVLVSGCTNATVVGNTIRTPRTAGIEVVSSPRAVISNNNIADATGFGATGFGITITTSAGVALRGNTINNCARDGIKLVTVTDSMVTENRVDNCGTVANATYSSIVLTSTSNNNMVANNICRMPASGNRVAYGLSIEAGCTGNIAVPNDLLNSGVTASFNDAGTGTITTVGNRL